MAKTNDKNSEEIRFEEAMTKLEGIADMLQDQNVPLDDAIAAYEEGLVYFSLCKRILDNANQKILLINENGETAR